MGYEDYCASQENNQNHTNLPSTITIELLTPIKQESVIISTEAARSLMQENSEVEERISPEAVAEATAGVHFLTDDENGSCKSETAVGGEVDEALSAASYEKRKNELLEYTGHVSSRHNETPQETEDLNITIKEEPLEPTSSTGSRRRSDKSMDWEERREKEEKLVADIIDRVRKECEAQGGMSVFTEHSFLLSLTSNIEMKLFITLVSAKMYEIDVD
nr:unnamed protein product [Callosobruchus analis]